MLFELDESFMTTILMKILRFAWALEKTSSVKLASGRDLKLLIAVKSLIFFLECRQNLDSIKVMNPLHILLPPLQKSFFFISSESLHSSPRVTPESLTKSNSSNWNSSDLESQHRGFFRSLQILKSFYIFSFNFFWKIAFWG